MTEITNISKSQNYMTDNKIFILGEITQDNTAELLGRLAMFVDNMEPYAVGNKLPNTITNPYTLGNIPIIDVYISSTGGSVYAAQSILSLLNIARTKGANIRTTVMGRASSVASRLAIQGDPNLRIMYHQAYHFIHYGKKTLYCESESELIANQKHFEHSNALSKADYMLHTRIPEQMLNTMMNSETGYLYPNDCLKFGLCDWIITPNGLIGRNTKHR